MFVIGGGQVANPLSSTVLSLHGCTQVYTEALASPLCEEVYLTKVQGEMECDTFFPALEGAQQDCRIFQQR